MSDLLTRLQVHGATLHAGDDPRITCTAEQAALAILDVTGVDVEWEARQQAKVPGSSDPTDPGHDVNVLREHVRHLERRVRQLTAEAAPQEQQAQVPDGWELAPHYRGYALLGTGRYRIDSTDAPADPELGAELIISIASEKDREGREIGERRYMPARTIQPEDMAVRIGFLNERGLFALEAQLWMLRQEHWPGTQSAAMLAAAPEAAQPEPAQQSEPTFTADEVHAYCKRARADERADLLARLEAVPLPEHPRAWCWSDLERIAIGDYRAAMLAAAKGDTK